MDEISVANNFNNRKKQNQLNELDQNTSMAQQQANLPVVQSLAQKTNFGDYGSSFANGMVNRLASANQNVPQPITEAQNIDQNAYFGTTPNLANKPTQYEQNWNARQDRMLSNPVINSILATKATPETFTKIDGFSDTANNALRSVIDTNNAKRQDAYNMAQLNAITSMYNANAGIYNTEMGLDGKSAQNAHLLFKEQQDQLKLRNSMADNVLAGIAGYADLSDENVKGKIRADYIQSGILPESIEKDGWFGSYTPKYSSSTVQAPQQNMTANNPKWGAQFNALQQSGLQPKVRNVNGKDYIEVNGMFYEQR